MARRRGSDQLFSARSGASGWFAPHSRPDRIDAVYFGGLSGQAKLYGFVGPRFDLAHLRRATFFET